MSITNWSVTPIKKNDLQTEKAKYISNFLIFCTTKRKKTAIYILELSQNVTTNFFLIYIFYVLDLKTVLNSKHYNFRHEKHVCKKKKMINQQTIGCHTLA